MHFRCRFFFVSLLLGLYALPLPVSAQEVTFTHVTTDDGLPSNVLEVILQDHRGYLWIGTTDEGLVRYDGYEMKVYQHVDGDATSLSPGTVWDLHESADSTLWIGTLGGLSRFDAATETFKSFQHVEGDATSLSNNRVRALHESDDGMLWVGTNEGLNRFDAATETFQVFRHVEGDATSLSDDTVWALEETDDGTFWVGTLGGGLNRFDAATETFKAYRHVEGDPTSLSSDGVWALQETDDGTLWVGTLGGGLNRFDAETETFTAYRHVEGDATSLSHDLVFALHESDDGTLWVGTDGGLNRFEAETETFQAYRHIEGDATSLGNNRVIALDETHDGMLWAGTWVGGLNRFDPASGPFKVYREVANDPASLSHDVVLSLHESADSTLWVGTGGGLHHFDPVSETFQVYRHIPGDATSLSDNDVFDLHESADGTLWVGTRSGLNRFDPVSETFKVYRHVPDDPTSLSHNRVIGVHQTDDGTLWVRTGVGLDRFDAASETFEAFRHVEGEATSLSNDQVVGLHESDDGLLWIGTDIGLYRFDPATEAFEVFRQVVGNSTSLSHNKVRSLHESVDGTLWIGTADGLNRLEGDPADPASVVFSRFLTGTRSSVRSILEDEQDQLWLGLADGRLARFNPETSGVRYFGKRHGLPTGGFYPGALQHRKGTLYWGNGAGLVSLRLERLPPVGEPPVVHLTELWLFDEPLAPGPDSPLKQALWQTESLRLNHDQNELTFGFVGIHYADPSANRYQYRLLGYDRDWRSETTQRRATYTNLPPGAYTFEVKASNSDGIWTPEPVRLGVVIRLPWWKTWWAYLLYSVPLFGLGLAIIWGARRRAIQQERERSHEALEAAYSELDESHRHLKATQAQLIQSEKMASLGALTAGIAHEIKNPLNFVNNFADLNQELASDLTDELDKLQDHLPPDVAADFKETLSYMQINAAKIREQGQRADGIVQSMMQHASGGAGQREATDVNTLVEEYVGLAYHGKRAQVPAFNAEILKELSAEVGSVALVPQDIGRVLLNLCGNAFDAVHEKAVSAGGAYEPTVSISTHRTGDAVEICIADNGPGIDKEVREKIFEPFFTTKPTGSGTGLGLSLSYEIVAQGHGGTLAVEGEEGEGATFIVTLPGSINRTA